MGNYAMSQLCAEKARSLNDADPGIYNNMGVTSLAEKNEHQAIENFRTAIKLDPGNVEANLNLGYLALNSGDYDLARSCFEAVVKQFPGNVDAELGYAIALRGTKDLAGAEKIYDTLLAREPKNRIVVFNAATFQEKYNKDFKKAGKILAEYQVAMAGQVSPGDELFERIDRVKKSQDEEERRAAEEKKRQQEEAERKSRAEKLLKEMADTVASMEKDMAACPAIDPNVQELVTMTIEQAKPVIADNDASLANDMKTFVDDAKTQLEAAKAAACGGAAAPADGTAAPAAGGTAPAPTDTPAPAPSTPTPQ
jgi:tetratricopeptide (TPR) repeat protein